MSHCYRRTPVFEINEELFDNAGIRVLIKREDQNHPEIAGNKWWKLKYNIEDALLHNYDTLLTFGGAYSNHIYATAAAACENGFRSIGIIRGEETFPLNDTLSFAKAKGMQLYYISREEYKQKNDPAFIEKLGKQFGRFYMIPEGGTNELAVKGCEEFAEKILSQIEYDYLCLPVGTGGTISGIICGLADNKKVIGVSVLKDGEFLKNVISQRVKNYSGNFYENWSLLTSYHHGGYAKVTKELMAFIEEMHLKHKLPLDRVYTAKMVWAMYEEIKKGIFERGSTLLLFHTGGLQGSSSSPNHLEKKSS